MTGHTVPEAARDGRRDQFRRPARSARAADDIRSAHGGRRLATGTTVAAVIVVAAYLLHALIIAPLFPPGRNAILPWVAFAVTVLVVFGIARAVRGMPDWLFGLLVVGLAVTVLLSVFATAGLLYLGITPTAAPAAGGVLMVAAAIRETRVPLATSAVVAGVLVIAALVQVEAAGTRTVVGVAMAMSTVVPVVIVTVAIRGFRRIVGRELDLSLVQSTVATPRSAVGMRASEELAELDFDAEALLDDVGSGRIAIPLPDEAAERAGSLAARLRVRLIEGRTDTWLRHAVTESAYLNDRVSVDDPTGCAGLLSPAQRDGLLLAIWLIGDERSTPKTGPIGVIVRCREMTETDRGRSGRGVTRPELRISIDVSGVTRRHVDAGAWEAVGSVGTYDVASGPGGFRIDIDCRTDPNVRAGGTASAGAARPRGA
ncbi:MAG TPA: hypothetical protein VKA62_01915 [Agromyces sp.]|nr:hypothetical protein [Agromyces sp.]